MKVLLPLLYYVILINIGFIKSLDLEFRKKWIRKHFDLNKFNGTWFEAGRYGTVIEGILECPSWLFSVKPGGTEMDVQYHTLSLTKRNPMSYTGTLKLKTGITLRPGRPTYEMDLYPSLKENWFYSGEAHVDVAVIDTDYDFYAFLYIVQRPTTTTTLITGETESIIALSKYQYYAVNFRSYWMNHYLSKIITLQYCGYHCIPKLREDTHPTAGTADETGTAQETKKLEKGKYGKSQTQSRETRKT